MARLDIYDNPIEEDRHAFPYVMDIQSDLLYRFAERVCVPLAVPGAFPGMTKRFNPAIAVNDQHSRFPAQRAIATPCHRKAPNAGN
ncbi:CcdB family protein [Acidovorax sp. 39-64-12]|uniref:CcdB family protein n=1 Tax=Acidovorax sp. 39-64-12 TaxID=1970313 RepID=UPI000BCF2425|nr:CcdB family protein [Acidovorax sp. 39-64-12]OZA69120.1 MAG: hypothetical protein B7X70_12355 [Acidovorax sp. 39-64-12]